MAQPAFGFDIGDRFYGKEMIKIVEVERNGATHTIKEYQMELKMSLAGVKEYMSADNRDIVCADGCKDALYILANNHGIKSPEEFGVMACNHLLALYSHMTSVCLNIEDFSWNRITYEAEAGSDDGIKLHNHAFIHSPECVRTCSVTLNRNDTTPSVVSGIKNLRLLKTAQTTFAGFRSDAYRTLVDRYEKVLSTNVSCSWTYGDDAIGLDYDRVWTSAKNCIIRSWGGDAVEGVLSTCIQFTLAEAERCILNTIPEIASIEMLLPNLLYADFDLSRFKGLIEGEGSANRKIYQSVEKPSGKVYAKMISSSKHCDNDRIALHVSALFTTVCSEGPVKDIPIHVARIKHFVFFTGKYFGCRVFISLKR